MKEGEVYTVGLELTGVPDDVEIKWFYFDNGMKEEVDE